MVSWAALSMPELKSFATRLMTRSALNGDVLRESAGSVFKEGPIGLLVVPPWKSSFCAGFTI